ncbi:MULTISPECIES: methylated-DNA--[protein]-cysteine S-methyltransferase [Lachnospiraceae]|jgi:methylated-DNA-[protein]-cysteine S-methyltransferase|uniref:Methylated-DNA--protein-cysteine methyltransferase n=1 Tax=Faecalicatena acetigenes TaxID=2981790 RepID=A0ABT2TEJ1_9FIRM|nr:MULTISPECIES: methylated-DNA--[protein]-cysteine S-methyltransferase [Lachnospiraceae]MCU6748697.1 methylated-DNA--[protein]-cysteine S-methyltransferase [Faecalicatena acetigenes]RGT71829.1 methylated-DNA--[protein]-cysteine S-methyltransferase [Ruminococcus sp. AF18-22]SCI59179.1 Methylated-DNA--protein-cysteine methyltransferase%2C constitutive [uncultured Clostridium sp.]
MEFFTTHPSPVGRLTLGSDGQYLIGLWIEGQKYFGSTLGGAVSEKGDLPVFMAAKEWLERYFAGERPRPDTLPLCLKGSIFQQRVWKLLCEIPYGEVTTYGMLASKVAEQMKRHSMSGQAVGGAVGRNPLSIIIPCHRVVGSDGSLTGYAGGINTKVSLLKLEGADLTNLYVPKKK